MIRSNKPFIKSGYLGLAFIIMSVLLLFVFPTKAPSLPEGFCTPIIAFEFIQTKTEVIEMFGGENITMRNEMARAMDLGNRLDYVYMCLYSAFLLMVSGHAQGFPKINIIMPVRCSPSWYSQPTPWRMSSCWESQRIFQPEILILNFDFFICLPGSSGEASR
jgi:hypothetical protein